MARKYSSIWTQLKQRDHCAIAAPIPLHPRIIKAVTAEKYRDEGYKLQMLNERKRVKILHLVDGARIRFFLRKYDILTGISLEELTVSTASITHPLTGESNESDEPISFTEL